MGAKAHHDGLSGVGHADGVEIGSLAYGYRAR